MRHLNYQRVAPRRAIRTHSDVSKFLIRSYNSNMAEHIEDLQQRFSELNKRIELVRNFL